LALRFLLHYEFKGLELSVCLLHNKPCCKHNGHRAYKYMYNHVQRQKLEMGICPLNLMFVSLHSKTTVTLVKQDILTSREHLRSPMILVGFVLLNL